MLPNKENIENQNINLTKTYFKIKRRCLFQKIFSGFLLCIFFTLQYSVPILLGVLGSVTISGEQLKLLFPQEIDVATEEKENNSNNSEQTQSKSDNILISRIIFLLGLITILLGVINNIINPALNYDIATEFNNKFYEFDLQLDLAIVEVGGITRSSEAKNLNLIVKLLFEKNQELSRLIDEYNKARSLHAMTSDLELLKQKNDDLKNTRDINS